MKSIFVDCNNQTRAGLCAVQRPDDPPIAVNTEPFTSRELPQLLAGYAICLDDHSYMPTEFDGAMQGPQAHRVPGHRRLELHGRAALNELGVEVHTIKGYGDTAVAEHAIALMFACCRGLARMDRTVRGGTWEPLEGMQLNGKVLGVVGLGGIGREVARIARGIGMEVIAWNARQRPGRGCAAGRSRRTAGAGPTWSRCTSHSTTEPAASSTRAASRG